MFPTNPQYPPPPGYPTPAPQYGAPTAPHYPPPQTAPGYGYPAPTPGYPPPPAQGAYTPAMPHQSVIDAAINKIAQAEVYGRGVYLADGQYRVRIERVYFFETRKKELMFIIEFTVIDSPHPEHPPGSVRSWSTNFSTNDSAAGNIKGFIGACAGIGSNKKDKLNASVTPQVISSVTSPMNPMGGLIISVGVSTHANKTKAGEHTRMDWRFPQGKDPSWTGPAASVNPDAPTPGQVPATPPPAAPAAPTPTSVWTPPAPPMQAPPPPPVPAGLPPGWFSHPTAPGYAYNAGGEMRLESELRSGI